MGGASLPRYLSSQVATVQTLFPDDVTMAIWQHEYQGYFGCTLTQWEVLRRFVQVYIQSTVWIIFPRLFEMFRSLLVLVIVLTNE